MKNKVIIGEITKSDGSRMRNNKPNKNSRYKDGYYILREGHKYKGDGRPIYRSSLEYKFMSWCETNRSVLEWINEPFAIGYMKENGKQGNYYIDFVVKTSNGEHWLVEVKPKSQCTKGGRDYEMNKRKWNATIKYCKKNGYKFIIVTEDFKPFRYIREPKK